MVKRRGLSHPRAKFMVVLNILADSLNTDGLCRPSEAVSPPTNGGWGEADDLAGDHFAHMRVGIIGDADLHRLHGVAASRIRRHFRIG